MLYQTIESKLSELKFDGTILCKNFHKVQKYLNYDCVICDESHYLMADANFNTNTIYSYKFISDCFKNIIRIYMFATIRDIKDYIEKDGLKKIQSTWLRYHLKDTTRMELLRSTNVYMLSFYG